MEKKDEIIVREILSKYPYQFFAFGSRVKGTYKKFSDLDLVYKDDIPLNVVSHIEEDFEESDLPFTVDLVDWRHCSEDFRRLIESTMEKIQ